MIITSDINDIVFDVEFMTCVVDKADDLVIKDCDSHFSEFVGVHISKIHQGKLWLFDILKPKSREDIMRQLCKKNSPYIYLNFYIKNKDGEYVYVHCTGQNDENSNLCRLTLADVSRSVEKSEKLKQEAKQMNRLIDLVTGGVALFKVNHDMHFEALYLNQACCDFFGTSKAEYKSSTHRIDDLIYPEDKSAVFQAIGNCMATKKPISMELRILTHKNEFVWCKMDSAIQRIDDDGCPIFHAIFTNITKVKEAEQNADRQYDLLLKIFKNLPGALFWTELNDPFQLKVVSSDFVKLIGYSRKELFENYNGDLRKLMLEREIPIAKHAFESNTNNDKKTIKATYSLRTKSGKYLVVLDRRKIVEGDNGEVSTIGLLRDITASQIEDFFDI